MEPRKVSSAARVAHLVRRCLKNGHSVQIDGIGTLRPKGNRSFEFIPANRPKVFLAYADEDLVTVKRIHRELTACGFDPWLDKLKLLPGQNWPRSIGHAIELSDFFIACLSRRGVGKRGNFQSELRYALDCAALLPLEEIFFIPVRLDDCAVPPQIARVIQYVDLFPDFEQGLRCVVEAMRRQLRLRMAGPGLERAG